MKLQAVRQFALSLPETTEEPHHELWSFRVKGKIFATMPPAGDHLHIFVDEEGAREAINTDPAAIEELKWGQRFAGVRVTLSKAKAALVRELLERSWRRKAPKSVVARFDAQRGAGE